MAFRTAVITMVRILFLFLHVIDPVCEGRNDLQKYPVLLLPFINVFGKNAENADEKEHITDVNENVLSDKHMNECQKNRKNPQKQAQIVHPVSSHHKPL